MKKNSFTIFACMFLFYTQAGFAQQNDNNNSTPVEKMYLKQDIKRLMYRGIKLPSIETVAVLQNKDVHNLLEQNQVLAYLDKSKEKIQLMEALDTKTDKEFNAQLDNLVSKAKKTEFFKKNILPRVQAGYVLDDSMRAKFINGTKKNTDNILKCVDDGLAKAKDSFTEKEAAEYMHQEMTRCDIESRKLMTEELDKNFLSKKQSIVNSYIQKGNALSMCLDGGIKTQEGLSYCVFVAWSQSKSLSDFKSKKQKASSIRGESRAGFFNGLAATDMTGTLQNMCYNVANCVSKANTATEEKQCYANQPGMAGIGNSWAK